MNKASLLILALLCADTAHADRLRDQLRKTFPAMTVDEVKETGTEGVYEVTVGANVIYYLPATESIILGDMFSREGKNLTAARRQAIAAKSYASLDITKAIKIGSGPIRVILFSDPDCPNCRRVDAFLAQRNDVTLYVFLAPISLLHPGAETKSACILGAEYPGIMYRKALRGELDHISLKANLKGVARMAEHKAVSASMGIKGTPIIYVNGTIITGADLTAIEGALAGAFLPQLERTENASTTPQRQGSAAERGKRGKENGNAHRTRSKEGGKN